MENEYIPIKHPCWRYHATEDPRLCETPEDEAALGEGWADTPAAFFDEPGELEPAAGTEEPISVPVKRGPGRPRKNP